LVDALRERHDWTLTKRRRDPLIDALLDDGVRPRWIAERIGCHVRTVRRRAAARRPTPQNRMNKRSKVDKTRFVTYASRHLVLSPPASRQGTRRSSASTRVRAPI
jgi:hypothetical protein